MWCGSALAGERTRVAVMSVASSEPLRPVAESIAEQVLTDLGRERRFEVIGTSDVQAMLGLERQRQLLGCPETAADCMAELSAALGAPWVVTGKLAQLGSVLRLDLKLLRARDGVVVFRDGQTFEADGKGFAVVASLVDRLKGALELELAGPPSRVAPWVVTASGALLAVAGGVVVGVGFANYATAHEQRASTQYTLLVDQYAQANTLKLVGTIGGAVGVALLATGLVWALTSPGAPTQVSWSVGYNSLLVRGTF
jgi:TolB-like protein